MSVNEIRPKMMLFCMKDISLKHKILLSTQIIAAGVVATISMTHIEYEFKPMY